MIRKDKKIAIFALIFILIFQFWPSLDIIFSHFFLVNGRFNRRFWFYEMIFYGIPYVATVWVLVLLAVIGTALVIGNRLRFPRRVAVFLLLSLALGPGLLVNILMKDQMGRPRPVQTINFGGKHDHVRPFMLSKSCKRNCSFVSGHAASGFYLVSIAFIDVRRRKKWVAVGLITGGLIGLMRIAQGGHFLSDVVFSFFTVYLAASVAKQIMVWWYQNENCLHALTRSSRRQVCDATQ